MGNSKKYLLSTRPLPKSVIEEGAKKNVIIEELSFITTHPVQNEELFETIKQLAEEKHTVVFTSMNAVEAVAAHVNAVPGWRIYSIGNTTNKLIEEKWGSDKVAATADSASGLAERLVDDEVKEVIFFCGNIRREELPNKMRSEGNQVEEVIVYETEETPAVIEKTYDGILFFSPSTVNAFYSRNKPAKETVLFAIGKTTAEAIKQHKGQKVVVANQASKVDLAMKAIAYFDKLNKQEA